MMSPSRPNKRAQDLAPEESKLVCGSSHSSNNSLEEHRRRITQMAET